MKSPALRLAKAVFRLLAEGPAQQEELRQDAEERHDLIQARSGRLVAELRTLTATLRFVPYLAPNLFHRRARRPRGAGGAKLELLQVFRGLGRARGAAALIIVTLGVGTAALTVVYSVFDNVLPSWSKAVGRASEIVNITFDRREILPRISIPHFEELAAGLGGDQPVASYYNVPVHVARENHRSRQFDIELVTDRYFDVLQVRPVAGRTLVASDFAEGAPPVVLLSEPLSRQYFGDEPPVGRMVSLNGHAFEVVGIVPRDYRGVWNVMQTDLWTTQVRAPMLLPGLSLTDRSAHVFYHVLTRLPDGVPVTTLRDRVQFLLDRMTARDSVESPNLVVARDGLEVARGAWMTRYYLEPINRLYRTLSGGALLVFGVATLNAGLLLLLRSFRRQRDAAIRLAIGAGRGSTVRIALLESLLLSLVGGALALLLTVWTLDALAGIRLFTIRQALDSLTMNGTVFVVALGAVVAGGLIAGAVPAWLSLGTTSSSLLRSASVIGGRDSRLTTACAVVQIALLAPIVLSASLLLRSVSRIDAINFGLHTAGVYTGELNVWPYDLGEAQTRAAYRGILDRLRQEPGQRSAVAWVPEMSGRRPVVRVTTTGSTDTTGQVQLAANQVSDGFFATLGIDFLSGRDFNPSEVFRLDDAEVGVAIVNRAAATRLWGTTAVLGNLLHAQSPRRSLTVVGVVGDARTISPLQAPEPVIWEPMSQRGFTSPQVVIQVSTPDGLTRATSLMSDAVAATLPGVPVHGVTSLDERARRHFITQTSLAKTALGLSVVALVLAGIGLFGVIGHSVTSRRRELAIRSALGARPGTISRSVLRRVALIAGFGVALGVPGALVASRLVREQLYEVGSLDPLSVLYTLAAVAFLATVATASPIIRATRVPAAEVLRGE